MRLLGLGVRVGKSSRCLKVFAATINCRRRCGRFCDEATKRQPLELNKWISWLQSGIYIQLAQAQAEKYLPLNKSKSSIVFESLFKWFSLSESALDRSHQWRVVWFPRCGRISRRQSFSRDDGRDRFSDAVTDTAVSRPELHGNLALSLENQCFYKHAQGQKSGGEPILSSCLDFQLTMLGLRHLLRKWMLKILDIIDQFLPQLFLALGAGLVLIFFITGFLYYRKSEQDQGFQNLV